MASKKECPSCGLEVEERSTQCMYCGYEFPRTGAGRKLVAYILIALALIWLILGALF